MDSLEILKKELFEASRVKEPAQRSVQIASIVAEALRVIGQEAVLVGGAAVEFYTQGGYTTADIDLLAPGGAELIAIMESLGFEKIGKDFVNRTYKIYVEFPGEGLGSQERANQLMINERMLRIISIEDLIVDRLCSFVFWQSAIDGLNVLKLMENGNVDYAHLSERARQEEVEKALKFLQDLQRQVIRRKISTDEANKLLEKGMLSLKVKE